MAIQKHNIYYDASKPESGIYYYAENGEQKELFLNNVLSGENGISAISAVDGNTWVIGITDDYKDNIEKIPGLSDNFVILSADVGNKLYVSATDNWDILPYSGSTNISIHDHIIDFQNTVNLIGDDTHIAVVSSDNNIIVSALKDFVDEEYVDEAIASSVSGKFDSSAFNTYSGIIDNKIDKLSNDFNNKLDISATNNWDISAYIAGNHISIEDHIISIEDAKNLSGDEKNITVLETDDAFVISGLKDFVDKKYVDDAIASAAPTSAVANKLDKSVFSAYSADIALQLNNISADKLDTSAFTAYSAHALDDYYKKAETYSKQEIQNALAEKQDNLTNEQLSAISSVSAIQSISANWLTEEDIEDFITEDEVESVSSTLTAQTNYLSGIIDTKLDTTVFDTYTATALVDYYTKNETKGLINDLSGTVSSQLNNKLDTSIFTAYSGNINNQINTVSSEVDKKLYTSATNDWDVTPYSGINGIKVENHLISVSANYALSADVYSKSQIDDIIANFGGFQIVSEDAQGKPDVSDPSTKIIYLTLVDDDPAAFDKYREWIWTNSEWECIGIASIDLKDYAKTQDVIASANATSAWINNTFYDKTETSGKTEIQNALDTKLDTTAFNDYSDNIDEQLQTLSSVKLDTSAFTAYSDDIERQLDTLSAIKLDKTYSATVNEQLTAKLDTSAFTAYSAEINTELNNITADVDKKLYTSATDNWDYVAYSGGQNVSVVDHIIDISGTKSLSGDGKNIEVVELADTFIISATKDIVDKSYVDNNFVSKTDFGTYSGNAKNQIDSKLDISAFTAYSAHALDNYYTKDETSGKSEIQNALAEKQDNLTNEQLSAISSVSAIQSNTENWNAAYDTLTAYSADGKWLIADDITALATKNEVEIASGVLTAQTNYLSGIVDNKLDITTFDTYTATALDDYYTKDETKGLINDLSGTVDNRLTNKLDTSAFTAYSADVKTQIDSKLNKSDFDNYSANALNDYYTKNETDAKITDAINDISATVSTDYLKKADVQEYTAGNNIDITNYVISGRDWTPELNTKVNNIDFTAYSADIKTQIDSKLNKSDFDDYSATALVDYYKKSETSGKTEIQNALNTKLDTTAFNDYTATALDNYYTKDETSGKTEIQNALNTKLDTTAFNDYTATALNDIASNSGNWNASYTALTANSGNWNNTYNTVTTNSGKWENSYTALTANSALWLKEADVAGFATKTELNNASSILINQDNYLSGVIDTKLDTTAFNAYSAHALDEYYKKSETSGKTEIQNALGTKLDTIAFNNYSANVKTQIDSKLTKNDFDSYSAAVDNDIDYISAAVSSIPAQVQSDWEEINTSSPAYIQNKPVDLELSAGNGISITETNNTLVFAVSGNYADATEVDTDINYLSGIIDTKLDTTAFNDYSANIKTQIDSKLTKNDFDSYSAIIDTNIDYISAAVSSIPAQVQSNWEETNTTSPAYIQNKPDDLEMSAGNGISITEVNDTLVFAVSGNYADATEVNNKLTALSANKLDISATTGWDISAYSAGNNITIVDHVIDLKESKNLIGDGENIIVTESGSNIIVSALKDILDKDDFDSYSAIIDDDIDYLSAAIEDSILSVGTDLKIENGIISVNTNGIVENSADMSFVAGSATYASGIGAAAFGYASSAVNDYAFAAGYRAQAIGDGSHAKGIGTKAIGEASHAEGSATLASGKCSHAEGSATSAIGSASYAGGCETLASGDYSHAEGSATLANGKYSHAEGGKTSAIGIYTHAEGADTKAAGEESHAEGWGTVASGHNSHAEGKYTTAAGTNSHAEGDNTSTMGLASHAEGDRTSAIGNYTHTEGQKTIASNNCAHAEGQETSALSLQTHAEGGWTIADHNGAHAEGYYTKALGYASHAEGYKTSALNAFSHTEGYGTLVNSEYTHAEGYGTSAIGYISHAEGTSTMAGGAFAHAEGQNTIANSYAMHAGGMYNKTSADALFVIGNGSAETARSDAFIITSAGLASATILATSGIPDIEAAITSIPAQVQTDWEETNTASPAYIKNKPVDLEMSAGDGISITEVNDTLIFSVSGKLDTTAFNSYSAEIDNDIDYISAAIEDSCVKYNDIQYAIGSANTAIGSTTTRYSVALGTKNSAYNSFVIGNYNKGNESHIFGNSNSGINSYILGYNCTGTESYLFGKDLSGKSWGIELGDFGDTCYPVIVGNKNATKTSAYFVVGCGNTLGNADAFIVSSNKVASAADFRAGNGVSLSSLTGINIDSYVKYNDIQYAIGSANTATGSYSSTYSVALGKKNSAYNSFVIGTNNKGNDSYIFGEDCTGTNSYLFGTELSGKSWSVDLGDIGEIFSPVIVGKNNATKTSAYFVVGCGTAFGNQKADAFIVSSNKVASAADFLAGNGVSLSSLTGLATSSWVNGQIADAITSIPAQVQSDWSATNTASPAYILNKPNQIDMQCGTYLDITSANNQITLDADISAISAALSDYANVQSDWSATNTASPAYIQNKPDVLVPVSSVSFAAPTKIMVVTAMPAAANIDPTTIYLVKENVSN